LISTPVHVIAAGKAAASMASAWLVMPGVTTRQTMAVSTHGREMLPPSVEWYHGGHPLPDDGSLAAAARALEIARSVPEDESLVLLLSGGASALLAQPMDGITLDDKQRLVAAMLKGGADIHALNTVRKHLSRIKGGRLAAACRGATVTLAISDVVGDDLAVIGSGPAVPDPSTWQHAAAAIDRFVPRSQQPSAVREAIERGLSGALPETPKPGDVTMRRAIARVIASRSDAMRGAREAAERLGYRCLQLDEAVTGDARAAATSWLATVRQHASSGARVCVVSSGETTVRVTGTGKGGRNQEFALALAEGLANDSAEIVVASAGTDGVDGPTDAAGAVVDTGTLRRASDLGLAPPADYLADNNSYAFFAALGDLISTGPTDTNVGDLQVYLKGLPH
jgi:hydroxypyruvate reductase